MEMKRNTTNCRKIKKIKFLMSFFFIDLQQKKHKNRKTKVNVKTREKKERREKLSKDGT